MIRNLFGIICIATIVVVFAFFNNRTSVPAESPKAKVEVSGPIFGTQYGITVVGDYPGGSVKLEQDATEILNRINSEISTFNKNSELYRFNDFQSTDKFPISEDTALMIAESMRIGRLLNGVMDITVGPLVDLWGFGHIKKEEGFVPSDEEIAEAKKIVGLDKIHLEFNYNGSFLRKDHPLMRVDLATIGEGFAADQLAKMLNNRGISNYLVHVAGAMRAKGLNANGIPWKIAIEEPEDTIGKPHALIDIHNLAVSTAGSYRNYFEKNGKRFSHAINPGTGKPIDHDTVSVTVIGDTATFTDALDTGLLVMGADKALVFANENNLAIYCLVKTKDGFKARYSRAFKNYLVPIK